MNTNNFFAVDAGNTEIVIALIKNFKIYKIDRVKIKDFKKKKNIFKKFKQIKKILKLQKKIKCIIPVKLKNKYPN